MVLTFVGFLSFLNKWHSDYSDAHHAGKYSSVRQTGWLSYLICSYLGIKNSPFLTNFSVYGGIFHQKATSPLCFRLFLLAACNKVIKITTENPCSFGCLVRGVCRWVCAMDIYEEEKYKVAGLCPAVRGRSCLVLPRSCGWMSELPVVRWLHRKGPHLCSRPFSVISDPELRSPLTDLTRQVSQSITIQLFSLN